jgi:hypothetical protein
VLFSMSLMIILDHRDVCHNYNLYYVFSSCRGFLYKADMWDFVSHML